MDELAKYIAEEVGERDHKHTPECEMCMVWKAYDDLMSAGPLSEDEVGLAMHWIDRYAAGLDDYPQFDRIIERRALAGRM